MPRDNWLNRLRAFASGSRETLTVDFPILGPELLGIYLTILQAPAHVVQAFEGIEEGQLVAATRAAIDRIMLSRELGFQVPFDPTKKRDLMLAVGAQLRALDSILSDYSDLGPTFVPNRKWLFESSVGEGFVIPRARRGRPNRNKNRRTDLGSFVRRVLLHHRVIPAHIGGYNVKVHEVESALGAEGSESYGGALFCGLKLDLDICKSAGTFVVKAVTLHERQSVIENHLESAHQGRCAVILYPELTIDPESESQIQSLLRLRPWSGRHNARSWVVPLVVAGSWHQAEETHFVNVAPIYDGWGKLIARHRKLMPYTDLVDGLAEGIISGQDITVLAMEDALVAVGVCRDFCERGVPSTPYRDLDVDLFLVPSLADEGTMRGHLETASDVRKRYRAGSFVVQQLYPSEYGGPSGYVLSPYHRLPCVPAQLVAMACWMRVVGPGG
jgi:predicted amidohydrolase